MAKNVLAEITEIKRILAHLVGTADKPSGNPFSTAALDKAAKLFKKMNITKDEWVTSYDLNKYFKGSREAGKFIRDEFNFTNYYKKGNSIFYNKQDIINLAGELKARNVDLAKYMELRREQNQTEQKLLDLANKNRETRIKRKKKNYKLPDILQDITISDYRLPDRHIIEKDIESLLSQFQTGNYERYIAFYDNTAFIKYDYKIREYLTGARGTIYRSWCRKYIKAQYMLTLINENERTKQ